MIEGLADLVYEAAFVPELWTEALDTIVAASRSASGAILVFAGHDQPPRYRTTEVTEASLHQFSTTDRWRYSERAPVLFTNPPVGFIYGNDLLTNEQIERDTVQNNLNELGLDAQISAIIPMPTGEIVSFTFERWRGDGRHDDATIAGFNTLQPHLARAGLMAARLGLQQAQATVSALRAIGLPAAVMSASGRVRAANSLLEAMPQLFLAGAFERMAIADADADRLFQQAIEAARHDVEPLVRSIAVRAREDRQALVVHVLPLRRAAHDIFSGADILVAATLVGSGENAPSPTILTGLFDLTPAEARLASALASGRSLKGASADANIAFKTGRTYLERIFAKTGTHRQSELVALLKSAEPPLPGITT